jgi:hypothetical protein
VASLLVFYINLFLNIFAARMFRIPVSFDWNQVYYHIEDYQWTHDMVTTIFSFGPLMAFFLGIVTLGVFYATKEENSRLQIFFIWFSLIALNSFFGNLLVGNLFTRGMGYVFQWMFLSDTVRLMIALIGFFGLLVTAFIIRKPILFSANSYFGQLSEKNFPFYFTSQIIVPFLIGSFLSIVYFLPRILFQERYAWISMAVLLFIVFKNSDDSEVIYFESEDPPEIRFSKPLFFAAILIYFGLRISLNSPVDFF